MIAARGSVGMGRTMPEELFRVVGIRADGSRRVLVSAVSGLTAIKTRDLMPSGVFAETVIEPDADKESSEGQRSVELFPTSVQPHASPSPRIPELQAMRTPGKTPAVP